MPKNLFAIFVLCLCLFPMKSYINKCSYSQMKNTKNCMAISTYCEIELYISNSKNLKEFTEYLKDRDCIIKNAIKKTKFIKRSSVGFEKNEVQKKYSRAKLVKNPLFFSNNLEHNTSENIVVIPVDKTHPRKKYTIAEVEADKSSMDSLINSIEKKKLPNEVKGETNTNVKKASNNLKSVAKIEDEDDLIQYTLSKFITFQKNFKISKQFELTLPKSYLHKTNPLLQELYAFGNYVNQFISTLSYSNSFNFSNLILSIFDFSFISLKYENIYDVCSSSFCLFGIDYTIDYKSQASKTEQMKKPIKPEFPILSGDNKYNQKGLLNENLFDKTNDFALLGPFSSKNVEPKKRILLEPKKFKGNHFVYGIPSALLSMQANLGVIYARDQQADNSIIEFNLNQDLFIINNDKSENKWNRNFYSNALFTGHITTAYALKKNQD